MSISRRSFLGAAAAAGLTSIRPAAAAGTSSKAPRPRDLGVTPFGGAAADSNAFDPWIEIDAAALRANVAMASRLAGGRPILAVVKNNAYGLGLVGVARILEPLDEIEGFAVVRAEEAIALRDAGVAKPILLLGLAEEDAAAELVQRGIQLSACTDDADRRLAEAARRAGRPVEAHFYVDTGLGRMGVAWHRAQSVMERVHATPGVRVRGTLTTLTEETDFDREQLGRLHGLLSQLRRRGVDPGPVHAASSNALFHLPEARLDRVRPGIALYGAYPSRFEEERAIATLVPAFRLRARVVRLEQMRAGDSAGYGRAWVAQRPTWTATLPVGHADGYPRVATSGARVLIGGRTYPVIGAVSASHTILEIGDERTVEIGDTATLIGPDHADIHPNVIAAATGASVYDLLMHLHAALPRTIA